MNWPFVSRAALDASEERYRTACAYALKREESLLVQVARGVDRYDTLLEKYHALKVAGATVPGPVAPPLIPVPDRVMQAILKKAGGSRALRKHYADYVTAQRHAGEDDVTIAQAILAGQTDESGVPG
jgi:hypothetical protein